MMNIAPAEVLAQETGVEILAALGVKGGLVVHIGCGDGRLTAQLRPNTAFLAHGLDTDADRVAQARANITALGV